MNVPENPVYERYNDINKTADYDIECIVEALLRERYEKVLKEKLGKRRVVWD